MLYLNIVVLKHYFEYIKTLNIRAFYEHCQVVMTEMFDGCPEYPSNLQALRVVAYQKEYICIKWDTYLILIYKVYSLFHADSNAT